MKKLLVAAVAVVAFAIPGVAQAAVTQSFTTSQSVLPCCKFLGGPGLRNQGSYGSLIFSRDNYQVGGRPGDVAYFTFDISSSCEATDVTLKVTRFSAGPFGGQFLGGYLRFSDVTTPATVLNSPGGADPTPNPIDAYVRDFSAASADLASGTSFGEGGFPGGDGPADGVLSYPLNSAATAGFNAARGGYFSVGASGNGGIIFNPNTPAQQFRSFPLFIGSGASGTQQLDVTCVKPTTKEQCKNGGWRNYGFTDQGPCVSFVATGGKNATS